MSTSDALGRNLYLFGPIQALTAEGSGALLSLVFVGFYGIALWIYYPVFLFRYFSQKKQKD